MSSSIFLDESYFGWREKPANLMPQDGDPRGIIFLPK